MCNNTKHNSSEVCNKFATNRTNGTVEFEHNSLSQAKHMLMYVLDRNCSKTPSICHEEATCSLSAEVCVAERPISYRCVCNQGYTGDGTYCQGKLTVEFTAHSNTLFT